MGLYCDRLNSFASSISVLAITIGLVAGQSATQKSLALDGFSTSPAAAPAFFSINGAGASAVNVLFVGTGADNNYPFGSKGSWFNVFGVGNPPSLNADVPPAFGGYPNGTYGPVLNTTTFRYANVGSGSGIETFFNPPGSNPVGSATPVVVPTEPTPDNNTQILNAISFAASDEPLQGADIERVAAGTASRRTGSGKAIQVPVVGVGIALAFNRTGLNVPAAGLKLSRRTYCGIFNGTITNWNDVRIRADNGGAIISSNLPIKVIRRSDNSGSTFVLSSHLNTACKSTATPAVPAASVWNRGVGSISTSGTVPPAPPANTVVWPASFLSASDAVGATTIVTTVGAIGYVDSATRFSRSLPAALLQNKSGAYISPTTTGIQHALSVGTIVKYGTAPANRLIRIDGLADPTPPTAYPISAVSYLLFYDVYANTNIAAHIRSHINWALGNTPVSNPTADAIATSRGYAPLPAAIKTVSRTVVNTCVNTVVGSSPCTP